MQGRWSEAAALYAQIADEADDDEGVRLQALLLAGDALRRDDRPGPAARLLHDAAGLAVGGPLESPTLAQLAGVLHLAGALPAARDIADQAVAVARTGGAQALALDTLLGVLSALGDFEAFEARFADFRGVAPAGAVRFREAGSLRRRADLDGADAAYADAVDAVAGEAAAAGAAAAAMMGRAEVALFRGDPAAARERYDEAGRLWSAAGRREGLFRSEAGLLRAALLAGETPLPRVLDRLIRFAEERQLLLLEAHLRIVRGAARVRADLPGGDADLCAAIAQARQASARPLESRARLVRLRLGATDEDPVALLAGFAGDQGWLRVARGEAPLPW